LLVLSHKLNQALVVVAVVLVVAPAVAVVVIALAVVAVVMALVLVLSRALAVVVVVVVHRTHIRRALLTHVLHALLTLVRRALLTHVRQAHVLLSQNLAANAETLAVAKNESPQSSPFCMESSRFREDSSSATQVAALA
jgi:hypothetical protein